MMKRFRNIILILIGLAVLLFFILLYPRLPIITGYAAKAACSCHFLSHRSAEDIKIQDLYFSPLNLSSIKINQEGKSASASILGMQRQYAQYKPGFGCILIHGTDDYEVEYPVGGVRNLFSNSDFQTKLTKDPFIKDALDYVFKDSFRTRAVVVLHKDTLIAERYASDIKSTTPLLGWSMTKSITNALIGIAVKDGLLDIEQTHLFPQWENDDRKNISLDNLLHMNSGLQWEEVYENISDVTEMLYLSEDIVTDASDNALGKKEWYYASGTTNLLLGILRTALDSDSIYWTYPQSRLFEPLGMTNMLIETDEAGNFIGSSYGYGTAKDWLRFGNWFLKDGITTKGDTLLPSDWRTYSTTPVNSQVDEYGAQWWLNYNHTAYKDVPADLFSANGYQGQFVFIIPSRDLIVVRLGLSNDFDKNKFLSKVIAGLPDLSD